MSWAALGLVLCLLPVAGAQEDGREAMAGELSRARAQVAELQEELRLAQEQLEACQEHSLSSVAYAYGSLALDALNHLLEQTDLDERAYEHASATRAMVTDALGTASSVQIGEVMEMARKTEVYTNNVAPVVHSLSLQAQPYIDQYATPMLGHVEEIKAAASTAAATAQQTYASMSAGAAQIVTDYVPTPKKVEQSLGSLQSTATETVESVVAPIFNLAKKVSPKRRAILPKRTVDRLLLLVVCLVVLIFCLYALKLSMKIAFKTALFSLKKAFALAIKLPLKLALACTRWALHVLTCCSCCGLCGRKKQSTPVGKTDTPTATLEDVSELLKRAKAKDKLESAVTRLSQMAEKGTVMDKKGFGEVGDGKRVDKSVLKKAAAKFKELDLKKLGL